jgi:hypothetical protein
MKRLPPAAAAVWAIALILGPVSRARPAAQTRTTSHPRRRPAAASNSCSRPAAGRSGSRQPQSRGGDFAAVSTVRQDSHVVDAVHIRPGYKGPFKSLPALCTGR